MGGSARTVVLIGRTGNGKSATGNSILGTKAFDSKICSSGVTTTCEIQTTMLRDGQEINVIDTPGLFDLSPGSDFVGQEIIKCIDLAKDGIHAVLVVLSVRNRFTVEEESAIYDLQTLFGSKIFEYMIVVFTGGDDLEENTTLEDYLGRSCSNSLKDILGLCQNRCVLFDNKTTIELKKLEQVQMLLSLVNGIIMQNSGKSYSTDDLFTELKVGAMKLRDKQKEVDSLEGYPKEVLEPNQQMKIIIEMVELRLKEITRRLEQRLSEEQEARLKAENNAQEAQKTSDEKICKLMEDLKTAEEKLRSHGRSGCTIL